jgi:hypothetical protein
MLYCFLTIVFVLQKIDLTQSFLTARFRHRAASTGMRAGHSVTLTAGRELPPLARWLTVPQSRIAPRVRHYWLLFGMRVK